MSKMRYVFYTPPGIPVIISRKSDPRNVRMVEESCKALGIKLYDYPDEAQFEEATL